MICVCVWYWPKDVQSSLVWCFQCVRCLPFFKYSTANVSYKDVKDCRCFNVANTRIRWLGNFNIKTLLQSSSNMNISLQDFSIDILQYSLLCITSALHSTFGKKVLFCILAALLAVNLSICSLFSALSCVNCSHSLCGQLFRLIRRQWWPQRVGGCVHAKQSSISSGFSLFEQFLEFFGTAIHFFPKGLA